MALVCSQRKTGFLVMDYSNVNKDRVGRRKKNTDLSSMIYGKVPPQARELEEAVLGSIMIEKTAFDTVTEILKPDCFYVDGHQKIFKAMQQLATLGQPIDILTVVEALKKNEDLDVIGGAFYITRLTNAVVSAAHVEAHSRIILQKYLQRELIRISGEIISMLMKTVLMCLICWTKPKVICLNL